MRTEHLTAIALAIFTAGAGLAAYSVRSRSDFCPQPWAASVTAHFAPCQAFYSAMGHPKPEAVRMQMEAVRMQMGLLTPDEQIDLPATLVATRLAESVDPFFYRSGG
jgi:hypothetical protein